MGSFAEEARRKLGKSARERLEPWEAAYVQTYVLSHVAVPVKECTLVDLDMLIQDCRAYLYVTEDNGIADDHPAGDLETIVYRARMLKDQCMRIASKDDPLDWRNP